MNGPLDALLGQPAAALPGPAMTVLAAVPAWLSRLAGSPTLWAVLLVACGLWCLLPQAPRLPKWLAGRRAVPGRAARLVFGFGWVLVLLGLAFAAASFASVGALFAQSLFWILAAVTVGSAIAMITMRSAVYAAIWFAMSLVGTAGLLCYQGAQFLGVATIVVYAGAIVVTFLFVVMLAQPEGHEDYDRLSWGWYAKPMSLIAAALLLGVLTLTVSGLREAATTPASGDAAAVQSDLVTGVLHEDHMAHFGGVLFSQHLIAVEVAGTLLLVALVGAVAMTIHGRESQAGGEAVSHE